jgi:Ca-activated chloride channel family protein
MKWQAWAGLALFFLTATQTTAAQQPTYRAETELVNLNVSVVGPDSQPVDGLTREQFEVFEDGVRQELKFFAAGELPLDLAIMLDASASMTGLLPFVQSAALRLANALGPEDRATVMVVSGGLRILQPLTSDKAAVAEAVRGIKAAGRTPLYSSIYTALHELDKERRAYETPRRQAIVVLSDGQDTARGYSFTDLLEAVRRQAVAIYTIAPRPSETIKTQREVAFGEATHVQDFELRKLAAETGGRAFFPVALQELAGVYDDIANELAHQYSLGYQSSNNRPSAAFRQIGLRVVAPGVKWRTRLGYLAGPDHTASDDAR